jgi:hypothetical protein
MNTYRKVGEGALRVLRRNLVIGKLHAPQTITPLVLDRKHRGDRSGFLLALSFSLSVNVK